MREPRHHLRRWALLAPLGLAAIGFGLSLTGEAIRLKTQGRPTSRWFGLGTLGLIVVNGGIATVVEAGKHKALADLGREQEPSA